MDQSPYRVLLGIAPGKLYRQRPQFTFTDDAIEAGRNCVHGIVGSDDFLLPSDAIANGMDEDIGVQQVQRHLGEILQEC